MARTTDIADEARLLQRVTRSYHGRLASLIARLNHEPAQVTMQESLRLCVEVVDVVLTSQAVLARALDQMHDRTALRSAA